MMALGVPAMSARSRRIASLLMAGMLALLVASPAFGYNEENVKHIRVSRLDAIKCATPIRLVADLTDRDGAAVPGATVEWSFQKSQPGDSLNPTVSSSDIEGRARTTLTLACKKGTRIIRAHVPGDGTGKITIRCKSDTNCAKEDDDDDDDNDVHRITLERLDPISCTNGIRIRATLRDKDGDPVRNELVRFSFDEKERGDTLSPRSQRTDSNGRAITSLNLSCRDGTREIEAKADGKEKELKVRCGTSQGCDERNNNDNFIVAPFDRNGGSGRVSPWTGVDPGSTGASAPFGGAMSQYVAILVAMMVAIAVVARPLSRPSGFALEGLRRLALA
jgi:hypothetical protein